MATLSFRMDEADMNLVKNYAKMNDLSISELVRESVIDRIEDDLELNEERILKAWKEAKESKLIPFEKVLEELNLNEV